MTRLLPHHCRSLGALVLAALLAGGCAPADADSGKASTSATATPSPDKPAAAPTLVRTGLLRRGEISTSIEVTADIEAEVRVDVYAKVGPAYVAELKAWEGDVVRAGQPLVQLDDRDFRIALRRRESELLQATGRVSLNEVMLQGATARERMQRAAFERAEGDLNRAVEATSGGMEVLSRKELQDVQKEFEMRQAELEAATFAKQQAERDLELARLEVEAAQIELDAAQRDLDYTVVRSHVDGVVAERDVNVGLLVNSNTHLFTIVDPTRLIANLRIPQEELRFVRVGLPVEFRCDALPGRLFLGKVEALNPAVDPGSGLVKVRARLPDDAVGHVRPGMFARTRIVVESKPDALLLTKRAVVYEGGSTWFFAVEDGVARRHRFESGAATADEVEVLAVDGTPPDPAVVVITVGQDRLREGDRVQIVSEESETS